MGSGGGGGRDRPEKVVGEGHKQKKKKTPNGPLSARTKVDRGGAKIPSRPPLSFHQLGGLGRWLGGQKSCPPRGELVSGMGGH